MLFIPGGAARTRWRIVRYSEPHRNSSRLCRLRMPAPAIITPEEAPDWRKKIAKPANEEKRSNDNHQRRLNVKEEEGAMTADKKPFPISRSTACPREHSYCLRMSAHSCSLLPSPRRKKNCLCSKVSHFSHPLTSLRVVLPRSRNLLPASNVS